MGLFGRKQSDQKLIRDINELTELHKGKKLEEIHPNATTEQLATRAKELVKLQESLIDGSILKRKK